MVAGWATLCDVRLIPTTLPPPHPYFDHQYYHYHHHCRYEGLTLEDLPADMRDKLLQVQQKSTRTPLSSQLHLLHVSALQDGESPHENFASYDATLFSRRPPPTPHAVFPLHPRHTSLSNAETSAGPPHSRQSDCVP